MGKTRWNQIVVGIAAIIGCGLVLFLDPLYYRITAFSASLDEQKALIVTLCGIAPLLDHGQKGSEWLRLRNACSNVCYGAYFYPDDSEDLRAMEQLTADLEAVVEQATSSNIRESVIAAYDLLLIYWLQSSVRQSSS
jgi:hypothetical protein